MSIHNIVSWSKKKNIYNPLPSFLSDNGHERHESIYAAAKSD